MKRFFALKNDDFRIERLKNVKNWRDHFFAWEFCAKNLDVKINSL